MSLSFVFVCWSQFQCDLCLSFPIFSHSISVVRINLCIAAAAIEHKCECDRRRILIQPIQLFWSKPNVLSWCGKLFVKHILIHTSFLLAINPSFFTNRLKTKFKPPKKRQTKSKHIKNDKLYESRILANFQAQMQKFNGIFFSNKDPIFKFQFDWIPMQFMFVQNPVKIRLQPEAIILESP